jgi:exonuclease VII small subunit
MPKTSKEIVYYYKDIINSKRSIFREKVWYSEEEVLKEFHRGLEVRGYIEEIHLEQLQKELKEIRDFLVLEMKQGKSFEACLKRYDEIIEKRFNEYKSPKYHCDNCGKDFKTKEALEEHRF